MNENTKSTLRHCERVLNEELAPHFVPEAQFALVVLIPGNAEASVLMTTAPIDDVRAAFERAALHPDARGIVGDAEC